MIVSADARHLPLKDSIVHCIVTSPPYFKLRDYGHAMQIGQERTADAYVESMTTVFTEARRVLKDDGTLWLNIGDSYNEKTLGGIPWRVALSLCANGWLLRSDIIWSKPNPMPESATNRPTRSHEYLFLLTKSERYHYDAVAIQERGAGRERFGNSRAAAKAVNPDRNDSARQDMSVTEFRNRRSVWTVAASNYSGVHFATMPERLVEPCILAGCPAGGLVLDPFCGSGTVLAVAERLDRRAVGCDLGYHDLAKVRTMQMGLRFSECSEVR